MAGPIEYALFQLISIQLLRKYEARSTAKDRSHPMADCGAGLTVRQILGSLFIISGYFQPTILSTYFLNILRVSFIGSAKDKTHMPIIRLSFAATSAYTLTG